MVSLRSITLYAVVFLPLREKTLHLMPINGECLIPEYYVSPQAPPLQGFLFSGYPGAGDLGRRVFLNDAGAIQRLF